MLQKPHGFNFDFFLCKALRMFLKFDICSRTLEFANSLFYNVEILGTVDNIEV